MYVSRFSRSLSLSLSLSLSFSLSLSLSLSVFLSFSLLPFLSFSLLPFLSLSLSFLFTAAGKLRVDFLGNYIRERVLVYETRKNSSTRNYFVTDATTGKCSAEGVPLRRAAAKTTGKVWSVSADECGNCEPRRMPGNRRNRETVENGWRMAEATRG